MLTLLREKGIKSQKAETSNPGGTPPVFLEVSMMASASGTDRLVRREYWMERRSLTMEKETLVALETVMARAVRLRAVEFGRKPASVANVRRQLIR